MDEACRTSIEKSETEERDDEASADRTEEDTPAQSAAQNGGRDGDGHDDQR